MATPTEEAEPIEVPTPAYVYNHEPAEMNDTDFHEEAEMRRMRASGFKCDSAHDSSDGKGKEKDEGCLLMLIATLLQVLVLLLAALGGGLDTVRSRNPFSYFPDGRQRACFSVWGYKQCGAHRIVKSYRVGEFILEIPEGGWLCPRWRMFFTVASIFSIVGVAFALASLILFVLALIKCIRPLFAGVGCIFTAVMLIVCWACITTAYFASCPIRSVQSGFYVVTDALPMKDTYTLDAGFGVIVTASLVEIFVAIFAFLS